MRLNAVRSLCVCLFTRFAEEEALRVWQEEEDRILKLRQQEAERRAREKSIRSPTKLPSRPALRSDHRSLHCFQAQAGNRQF